MRLAEVYLIEAEANIEMADGNLELARTDINIIRNRVGMPDVVVTSQSGLRKALRYERTVELCNEGFRWFDLRRWGMLLSDRLGKISMLPIKKAYVQCQASFDDNWHPAYSEGSSWDGKALNLRVYNTMKYIEGKDETLAASPK